MNRSVIPKNWKEIQKKYYNKEPIIQGIKEAKYLNAKQDNKEISVGIYWMTDPNTGFKWIVNEKGEVIIITVFNREIGFVQYGDIFMFAPIINYLFKYYPEDSSIDLSQQDLISGQFIYNEITYDLSFELNYETQSSMNNVNGSMTPSPTKEIPFVCDYSNCAIDLGLPSGTLWANINIGQITESQQDNNKYYKYDSNIVKKLWNEEWDLPTEEQVQELIDNTNIEWDESQKGYYFHSNINENNIFLLAAGIEVPDMLPDNPHTEIESFGETGTYMIKSGKALEFMDEMSPRISTSTIGGQIWVSVRPVKNV